MDRLLVDCFLLGSWLIQVTMRRLICSLLSWLRNVRHTTGYHQLDQSNDRDLVLVKFLETRRCGRRGAVTQVLEGDASFVREMVENMVMWKSLKTQEAGECDIGEGLIKDMLVAYAKFFREECKDSPLLSDEELISKIGLIAQDFSQTN